MMTPPPSDEESLTLYEPDDEITRETDEFIKYHPLSQKLRADPAFTESRPHMKIPKVVRDHNLTAGTLSGPGRIVVPPYIWNEKGGKSLVSIFYLGTDVSGHPGIVHGGLLATILDESLARCCFPALPNKVGVTANLNINYRKPSPAGSFLVLRAKTTKVEGRKAWVEGQIETLVAEGEEPQVLVEASALFIEPKHASVSQFGLQIYLFILLIISSRSWPACTKHEQQGVSRCRRIMELGFSPKVLCTDVINVGRVLEEEKVNEMTWRSQAFRLIDSPKGGIPWRIDDARCPLLVGF